MLGAAAVAVAVLLALSAAHPAAAAGGPHGGYAATTDGCAGCHRGHTSTASKLVVSASTQSLCLTCHGSMATGAQTNVTDGVYAQYNNAGTYTDKTTVGTEGTKGAPLNGGGFAYYKVLGQTSFAAVTSTHLSDGTSTAAWGYSTANTGQTAALASPLTCGSCHDPHGNNNYRLIASTVSGVSGISVTTLETAKGYTAENWGTGLSTFCAACHTNYLATTGNPAETGFTGGSPSVTHYRHKIDMSYSYDGKPGQVNPETTGITEGGVTYKLPLAQSGTNNLVTCTTCHLPHGTSASMSGNAVGTAPAGASDSALLRLNNRGVCQVCHQK